MKNKIIQAYKTFKKIYNEDLVILITTNNFKKLMKEYAYIDNEFNNNQKCLLIEDDVIPLIINDKLSEHLEFQIIRQEDYNMTKELIK